MPQSFVGRYCFEAGAHTVWYDRGSVKSVLGGWKEGSFMGGADTDTRVEKGREGAGSRGCKCKRHK